MVTTTLAGREIEDVDGFSATCSTMMFLLTDFCTAVRQISKERSTLTLPLGARNLFMTAVERLC